jgi:hypothetical protein
MHIYWNTRKIFVSLHCLLAFLSPGLVQVHLFVSVSSLEVPVHKVRQLSQRKNLDPIYIQSLSNIIITTRSLTYKYVNFSVVNHIHNNIVH